MNKIELYRLVRAASEPTRDRDRNRPKPPTPRQSVLNQFRPEVGNDGTSTGNALSVQEILARLKP